MAVLIGRFSSENALENTRRSSIEPLGFSERLASAINWQGIRYKSVPNLLPSKIVSPMFEDRGVFLLEFFYDGSKKNLNKTGN